jgi:pyruvate,orthophosphate dikinase
VDTILNLGLNDQVVKALRRKPTIRGLLTTPIAVSYRCTPTWLWKSEKAYFEKLIDEMKEKKGGQVDTELNADDLKELARQFKEEYKNKIGAEFPRDPVEQLFGAIKAVFRSGNTPVRFTIEE